jgi:hypothetical protein
VPRGAPQTPTEAAPCPNAPRRPASSRPATRNSATSCARPDRGFSGENAAQKRRAESAFPLLLAQLRNAAYDIGSFDRDRGHHGEPHSDGIDPHTRTFSAGKTGQAIASAPPDHQP